MFKIPTAQLQPLFDVLKRNLNPSSPNECTEPACIVLKQDKNALRNTQVQHTSYSYTVPALLAILSHSITMELLCDNRPTECIY